MIVYWIENNSKATNIYNEFETPWEYKGNLYTLPYRFSTGQKEPLVISNTVPSDFKAGDILAIRTVLQKLTIYIEGKKVYECTPINSKLVGEVIPERWHFISLKDIKAGDKITVELSSSYKLLNGNADFILYGDVYEMIYYAIKYVVLNLLLSFISILFGAFILIVKRFINKEFDKSLKYLGLFFVAFGGWSLITSKLGIMPGEFVGLWLFLENFFAIVNALILLLYVREKYSLQSNRLIKIYIKLCGVNFITLIFLRFVAKAIYIKVFLILVIMVLSTITISILLISSYIPFKGERRSLTQFVGVFILVHFSLIDFFMYINHKFYYGGMFTRMGVIALMFSELIAASKKFNADLKNKSVLKEQLEVSRIKLMTRQMEPHFYSNALIAIQDLCYTDPDKAAESIALFYFYLRENMNYINEGNLISFQEERKIINMYIEIQKLCFGEELQFVEEVEVVDFYIPPLTLQPFVENAVKHGVRKRRGVGTIKLSTWYEEGFVTITIEDDGVGFVEDKVKEEKLGFSSTENNIYRIEKQCQGKVSIKSVIGKGTVVTVKIPRE